MSSPPIVAGSGPARPGALPSEAADTRRPFAAPAPGFAAAVAVVYRQQLARARVARAPLLIVAAFQSIGILLLLRGVVSSGNETTSQQVVAGSTVLVVGFVALNLLAQRLGAMRASGALDYYATLPVPPAAVLFGTAGAYASFAAPGTMVTAFVGAGLYRLPLAHLWLLVPVALLAGAALAGLGAVIGLYAPRAELATIGGQLGMSLVLFLSIIPASHLPVVLRGVRAIVPSTYAADMLADGFHSRLDAGRLGIDAAVCVAVAVASLLLGVLALRRAQRR